MSGRLEAVISYDLSGMVIGWSPGATRLFGYSSIDMMGAYVTRIIPMDEQAAAEEQRRAVAAGEPSGRLVTTRLTRDGSVIPVRITLSVLTAPDGSTVAFCELIGPVAAPEEPPAPAEAGDRVRNIGYHGRPGIYLEAELYQRVRDDPAIFDFLQDGSLDGLWYWDLDNPEHEWLSPRLKEVFGYADEDIPNTSAWWQANIFPEDLKIALDNYTQHLSDPHHRYDQIVRYRHRDGSTVWVRCRGIAIRDATGRPIRMLGAHTDVTPIKKVEERLRAINEASPDMYFTADLATGTIVDCNQSLAECVQRSEADIVGRPFVELCRPEYRAAAQGALRTLRSFAPVNDLELGLDRPDGPPLATVLTARVIPSEDGLPPFVRAWCRDITHLRRRANIQVLVDALPSAAVLLDSDGVIAMLNAPAERMFGRTRGELLGQPLQVLFPALTETRVAGPPMAPQAQPASQEVAAGRRDGTTFPAQVQFGPIDTREGPLTLVEILDATEQKKAEVALRDSEHRFRQLADSLPQLVWTCGPDGRCDYLGHQWIEYTGITAEPQLGSGWLNQVHPDDRADAVARWEQSVLDGGRFQIEYRLRRHDGCYRFFDVRAVPLRDSDGTIVKWFGACTDITERKQAEDELRTSRTHLTAALGAGQMGTWIFDADQDRIWLDDAAARLWGLPGGLPAVAGAGRQADPAGETGVADRTSSGLPTLLEHVHPEDRALPAGWPGASAAAPPAGDDSACPGQETVEFRVICPDGATRWIASMGRPVRDATGRTTRWLGVIQDVTARRNADEVRLRSQKLEALGTLAGGIAHDFNNILTAIAGNLQLALSDLPHGDRARSYLGEIDTAVNRAADLVRRILTFGRPQETERAVTAVGPIVAEALRLLRATLPAIVEISTALPDDLPLVAVDPTQVHQVIMNLGTNAAHAMGATGGNLTIGASCVRPEAELAQRSGLRPEPYVRLSVRDDGCGMDEATRARIFDPFFTTKPTGVGTGLGLSMVHRIMQAHGGAVAVQSTPGLGTEFELYFPVAGDPAPDDAAETAPDTAAGGEQRVLFVDDEPAITMMAAVLLESLGYEVTTANHPADALASFRAAPDAFDVLITDLTMPGMSGLDLAASLREIRADFPVVICSGLLSDSVLEFARDRELVHVLNKPYVGADLTRALNAMFNGRRPGGGP